MLRNTKIDKETAQKLADAFPPEIEPTEEDYVSAKYENKIYTSNFMNGKILSIVTDEKETKEEVIYQTSRTNIKATYISNKDQVVELKLQKYENKKGVLHFASEIRLDTKNLVTLTNFLKFLTSADISAVSAGKLSFDQGLKLDPDLDSKLRTLANDDEGKKQLLKLFDEGFLTSGFDIPELIKKGLSKDKIEEKRKIIEDFKELISKDDVKEVSDIQVFLKDNPWLFGPEYKTLDFRGAGFSGNPDGRLLRIDGLSDILEVKLPHEELLRADNKNRQFISPKLAESLGQLTGYLKYYYSEYSHERNDQTGEEILNDTYGKYYKPKGILLIGRRGKESVNSNSQTISAEPKNMRRLLSYFHWVEVLTYDDLIERAENGLNNLVS
jgi:hypothetical protein